MRFGAKIQKVCAYLQGIAPLSGYLGVFTIDINAVCSPEGAVYGQMATQFAVRSELR